jgi:hypothetical protein
VPADAVDAFADTLDGTTWAWVGEVTAEPVVQIEGFDGVVESLPVERLAAAWRGAAQEPTTAAGSDRASTDGSSGGAR